MCLVWPRRQKTGLARDVGRGPLGVCASPTCRRRRLHRPGAHTQSCRWKKKRHNTRDYQYLGSSDSIIRRDHWIGMNNACLATRALFPYLDRSRQLDSQGLRRLPAPWEILPHPTGVKAAVHKCGYLLAPTFDSADPWFWCSACWQDKFLQPQRSFDDLLQPHEARPWQQ